MDSRFEVLAKNLVNYSCRVQKGEKVLIGCNGTSAFPLVKAIIREVYAVGGCPYVDIHSNVIERELLMGASKEQYEPLAEIDAKNKDVVKNDPTKLLETLTEICFSQYQMRLNKDIEHEKILNYERSILLGVIDYTWINHIDAMTKLRNGIYLRAYAQKNPLSEYTEEAFYMFEQMKLSIVDMISKNIVHMGIRPGSSAEENIPHLKLEVEFK